MNLNRILWGVYATFVGLALYANWHPRIFSFDGSLWAAKGLVWLALIAFLTYSIHCSVHENIFRTIGRITEFHWGRQIGIDLYLGLLIALFLIYLHEGAIVAALWALPTLAFANLSILLYVGIHFDSIVSRFAG